MNLGLQWLSGKVTGKTVRWLLGGLVTLLVLGFLALPPLFKYLLVQGLGDALQREAAVERVNFNPLTSARTRASG